MSLYFGLVVSVVQFLFGETFGGGMGSCVGSGLDPRVAFASGGRGGLTCRS